MVLISELSTAAKPNQIYRCTANLNIYDSPKVERLATQAAQGRYLQIVDPLAHSTAIAVKLYEDDYPGWLKPADLNHLVIAPTVQPPAALTEAEIRDRLPHVIAFCQAAMATPNYYEWGGTVAPNYDCSGLMQAAFAAVGVWLPRDAYQQEAFTQSIAIGELMPGDLLFFGTPQKATHVALYLGEGNYIHSSGKAQGRNGIGIDSITDLSHPVSQNYFAQVREAGRVVASYQTGNPCW
ncbi:MAG TPA: C40 family peptidase [Leptolyngbyaceae cyanobacterium M33_DOE_097]|uniref:NlpC/P60 family protein n=1 Tax=Oscillatoriales cyanobacterium SpSt-418 TaxID=2282169 RepID=A0A7C3PI29_9CYAN|nr:C40 family peptidase [Leptolyngbyaceae cyanobacterium M33_DOE_097]